MMLYAKYLAQGLAYNNPKNIYILDFSELHS